MNKAYFVIHDSEMHERQSDGVELCIIPEFHNDSIYFYCSEYQMFWDDITKIGNGDECCSFDIKGEIRPASMSEICNASLCEHINSIKEYCIESSGKFQIKYINLKK